MAEAAQKQAVIDPVVPIIDEAPIVEEEDRGDQDVYQRKSHQAVKKLEGELASEREARIRLEEQVKFLSQSKPATTAPVKIFTPDEVQEAIDAGNIKATEGAAYLARIEAQRVLAERDIASAARGPVDKAIAEINELRKFNPWLDDKGDPRRKQIENEYRRMVSLGQPANETTELFAAEKITGTAEQARKRAEMNNLTRSHTDVHAETSNGGGDGDGARIDLSKATQSMQKRWDQTKTPPKARAEELRIYQAIKAGKRVV